MSWLHTSMDIHSEMQVDYVGPGEYTVTINLYRLATLEGTAKVEEEILVFEDEAMNVKGEIRIQDTNATFKLTEHEMEYLVEGAEFEFSKIR